MCGLAGEIARWPNARSSGERALPMLQAILHRGPDDLGLWEDEQGRACLLHARLSLVDVRGGAQPMMDAGNNIVIAFNGEFYGFERARRELEAEGVIFRTHSDTELLLQLYLKFGLDFLEQIEGEFALVLFDLRNGRAILARDRFGVKPLFYSKSEGLLLFGSEVKAILAHPSAERRLDRNNLNRRLSGVFLPEDTLFEGIKAIEPGSMMIVSRQGTTTRRYFDLDPEQAETSHLDFQEAVECLEPLLASAINKRFHGEAPVGLFLSSGVDSSSIAAIAGSAIGPALGQPIPAYSIDFKESLESERRDATDIAKRATVRAVHKEVTTEDLENAFEKSVWHAETIAPNAHGTAKMLLAGRARQEVTAVLTGEGADELHGGYAYFEHSALLESAATDGHRGAKDALSRFLSDYGPNDGVLSAITPKIRRQTAWSRSGGAPYAAMRARVAERGTKLLTTAEFRGQTREPPSQALLDWLSVRAPGAKVLRDSTLSRLVALMTDLPGYNLSSLGDRVEMANGLEARLPFLDRAVVDFFWRLPSEHHHSQRLSKRVLRAVLARRLPGPAAKPKRAFLTPGALSRKLVSGALGQRWLSRDVTKRAAIFQPHGLSATAFLMPMAGSKPALAFCTGAYLTMAISTHLMIDMFCERFPENLRLRSALSISELRTRLLHNRAPRLAIA